MTVKEKIKNIYKDELFDSIITMTDVISLPICIYHNDEIKICVFLYELDYENKDTSLDGILISSVNEDSFAIADDMDEISLYKNEVLRLLPQHIPREEFTLFNIQELVYKDIEKIQHFCFESKERLTEKDVSIVKDYIMSLKAVVDESLYDLYYSISPEFFEWMYLVVAEENSK